MPLYENIILSEWLDSAGPIPNQNDFGVSTGDLDAIHAWKDFGGLTRSEAFVKFSSNPDFFQEDFMFMGQLAFVFYFPVVERYIFQSNIQDDEDEIEAMWILSHCINNHFQHDSDRQVMHLRERTQTLVRHVRDNIASFCKAPTEQKRIDEAWHELEETLKKCV